MPAGGAVDHRQIVPGPHKPRWEPRGAALGPSRSLLGSKPTAGGTIATWQISQPSRLPSSMPAA